MASSLDLNDYKTVSSADILTELSISDGTSPIMAAVLHTMQAKLSEVRASYFRKPIAHMPFGVSSDDALQLSKLHPELREIIYEPDEAIPDAVFQGNRHLAVRRCLKQLLQTDDSAIAADPYAHQILCDGVYPYEHDFVFRYHVPFVDISRDACDDDSRHFVVADLVRSHKSISKLIDYSKTAKASELLVVAPYEPNMWQYMGGQSLDGAYVYEWMQSGRATDKELVAPVRLPSDFFKSNHYRTWQLYIQPYGSTEAMVYTRTEFVKLFSGAGVHNRFVETRLVRNGFAEVSIINFSDTGTSMDVARVVSTEQKRAIPIGSVEVKRLTGQAMTSSLIPGRHNDLSYVLPIYVRQSYYEKALQQFFRLRMGRDVIPAMMRFLHANSAHLVYNGAIVTAETMIDVESMCVVLEDIVTHHSRAKQAISIMGAQAKVPLETSPKDYMANVLKYASLKFIKNTDYAQAVRNIGGFVRSGTVPSGDTQEPRFHAPVDYGDPESMLDSQKESHASLIRSFAEDAVYGGPDLPYTLDRAELPVDRSYVFRMRMSLTRNKAMYVDINEVQAIYDQLLPGNSLVNPTSNQLMVESGSAKFIIDVQYFRASIPLMFSELSGYTVIPSQLRTSIGADLMHTFRTLMASLMKRNFNRPRPEAPGSRSKYVQMAVTNALSRYAKKEHRMMLARYSFDAVTVSDNAVNLWAEKHAQEDVLSAATMLEQDGGTVDPSFYHLMPKDIPKPALSLEPQGQVAVGQTIVFHSKDIISLTVGVFTLMVSRLLALFNTNVRFAFGADEHRSGIWADEYLRSEYYVTEIDVPKFDKSQDWACFELILHVMELMGASPDLVLFWRKATDRATVFNATFHLVFHTMFGNRSGNGATLATNCIVLLFAFMDSFDDAGIVAMLIKGDDSVLVTRRPILDKHSAYLYQNWGFSMKLVGKRGAVGFCSSVFVKDSDGHYQLVRDVVRVIEKFGRALPVNKPASYFLDYYVSVLDTAVMYEDPIVVQNLTVALHAMYGTNFDVKTLCDYVRYVSQSTRKFLKELYGLTDKQVDGLQDIDEAIETMTRLRNSRFVKAKGLVDLYEELKLPFVDRAMIMSDWVFTD